MDKLWVGLRMEAAEVDRFAGYGGSYYLHENKSILSFLGTTDYYFSNNYNFRPLLGAGAGASGIAISGYHIEFKFGATARFGAEIKHFRLAVEYNFVPDTEVDYTSYDNLGNPDIIKEKLTNVYIGFKLGFCFGGGRL